MTEFLPADRIRARFSAAMSEMYRREVPLYGELLDIVAEVNAAVLDARPALRAALAQSGEIARLDVERHGAVRVGTPDELRALRRVFAVMGMLPVGYYDLSVAGVPVHSTAFRPVDAAALNANPFRVFTSLLRPELIDNEALRGEALDILARRTIVSAEAMDLAARCEARGGLTEPEADAFVAEVLETFRWHGKALVDAACYERLNRTHRLIADIVSFRGPHINHLTPRTLDIDAAQAAMLARGIVAKEVIEGPPARRVPILLRQTSFTALEEAIVFEGGASDMAGTTAGSHTARFGEIEQRGVALTPAGRALYDACLDEARGATGSQGSDYAARLSAAFSRFPDDFDALRRDGLAYVRYVATGEGRDALAGFSGDTLDLEAWIEAEWVVAEPIVYEDFLPVSAAGIFQSNLARGEQAAYAAHAAQAAFEDALGASVLDPFALYEAEQARSLAELRAGPAARG